MRSTGDGDAGTVLFVHGFPFDGSIWDAQLAALPEGWRGLAPDLRGFGRSPLGADELPSGGRAGAGVAFREEVVLTMDALAADLAETARKHADGPVVVCGLSMGGYAAFALLRKHPDLIRALVLMDTRAEPDGDAGRETRRRMAATARQSGARAIASAMLPGLLSTTTRQGGADVAERIQAMIEATPPRTIVAALAGMASRPDSTRDLPGIMVPTLVIVGAEDTLTPPESARAMAEAIPGAQLEVIAGAAHLPCVEAPEETSYLLADFLNDL